MDAEALLVDLDPDQRRAVTTESHLVAVVAGAGSGKTRVLTRRVAYRIAEGTADAQHTLVLTFTRQAAGELKRRLPRLGTTPDRVTTGTFHAVAYSLLQQRWKDRDQQAPTLTNDRRRILASVLGKGGGLDAIADEVDWASAHGLSPAGYTAAVRNGQRRPAVDPGTAADAFERYRNEKRRRGVIDLDDLLSMTISAIDGDSDFADALRWRFRHVLVDEAQDLNPLQHRLVDQLRQGRDDLFLVGDPAQSIYGFNGADPSLLVDVETRFPGVEVFRLPVNHRCTPQIVDAGVHVLSGQAGDLRSARDDGHLVDVVRHDDEQAESTWIARTVLGFDPALVRGNEVGVLARTNAQLPAIERALTATGIAVRRSVHHTSPIRTALNAAYRSPDPHQLRRWAHDTLEADAADDAAPGSDDERTVAQLTLDFLRAQPNGDGGDFRSWVDTNDPFGQRTPGVELLTFHASKGREWHTVVLAGCETSLVPHRSATTAAAKAEEARLLYVAVTRASDRSIVSWAERRGGYQRKLTPLLDGFVSTAPEPAPPPVEIVEHSHRSPRAQLLDRLRAWRSDAARAGGIVPEAVCTDAALAAIADNPPASPEELDQLTHLGLLTSRRLFPGIAAAIRG